VIYCHRFRRGDVAMLRCDKCGRELSSQSDRTLVSLLHADFDVVPGHGPAVEQQTKLRRIAQDAGWAFRLFDSEGDSHRDLCADCCTLPPDMVLIEL
jgi:hypothetical protein